MIIAAFALSFIIAFGAYNGTTEVKRVVSTKAMTDIVFSSNAMENPAAEKNLHANEGVEYSYPVTVCNFAQMTPSAYANETVSYALTVELVTKNNNTYEKITTPATKPNGDNTENMVFTVQKIKDDNIQMSGEPAHNLNTGSFEYTYADESLASGASNTDAFLVTFDSYETTKETPQYYIHITATPTESTALQGRVTEISCYLSVSKSIVYPSGWSGTLAETDNADYDAYNMIVSGSGSGTIVVRWNSTKFEISDVFINDTNNKFVSSQEADRTELTGIGAILDDDEPDWKKIILEVDSINKNRYEIQFFKSTPYTYDITDPVSDYIKCNDYVLS